ncbi:MAG: 4-(cytidine 5'-diphospho)-2-C-methyl-D-erythritol kinase [Planctomycetaceae bacterium]|nr:4-(cytidine 5'-diphospho)-2-C-methyl-D-erythritol kinase [Planctomycetaceae bacterium]
MVVRHQGPSLVIHTPAKLNLFLDVLGKRPDGYHSLETVMVSVGLYDSLVFREIESNQTRLNCHRCESRPTFEKQTLPTLPAGPDNLVLRAADLLRKQTGCDQGVEITLVKRIPMQAGMGGGSSDAAATLVGLNQFWGCDLTSEKLHMLAAELGSDVNFFLESPIAAVCRGRGEVIEPVRLSRRFHAVVACPSSGLSTANVFRAWASERQRHASVTSFVSQMQRGTLSQHDIHNALERPARELNGDVARTLDSLRRIANGPVGMSGSGTSCFVLCRTAREAGVIAGRLSFDRSLRVFPVSSRV